MSLPKTKIKQHCPCCGSIDHRWLYSVNCFWYCVPCLKDVFGMLPAKIARVA